MSKVLPNLFKIMRKKQYCRSRTVERGVEENAVDTARFISWLRRSRESLAEVRRGYSSWEDEKERESKEVDISLMNRLDILASGVQKEGERSFWGLFSFQLSDNSYTIQRISKLIWLGSDNHLVSTFVPFSCFQMSREAM